MQRLVPPVRGTAEPQRMMTWSPAPDSGWRSFAGASHDALKVDSSDPLEWRRSAPVIRFRAAT